MASYPSDNDLQRINNWDFMDAANLMAFIKSIWEFSDWGFRVDGQKYSLSTGGWSGNEDIIETLQGNVMFWSCFWQSSRRGGHYEFDLGLVVEQSKESEGK